MTPRKAKPKKKPAIEKGPSHVFQIAHDVLAKAMRAKAQRLGFPDMPLKILGVYAIRQWAES